ncbi:MAG: outer membrane beta-barrel protein [Spirochaetaceae bacterium]|nr:outer membrane beta-barrel protein [Spirochaetaceae bacterium]
MNCKTLLIAFIMLPLGLGHTVYGQNVSYNEGLKRVAESIGDKVSPRDTVAVVEFRAATGRFSDRVIDDLIDGLFAVHARVVDRQNLEAVRAEQEYQYSGYADEESAVSLGHELGAAAIILGTGENMADYYRLSFRMVSVQTREILARVSVNVRYDSAMRRLLGGRADGSGIGTTHFMAGVRLGAGFEINTAHEDFVGEGFSLKEESNTAFNAALYAAVRFNDVWSLQAELNLMRNNGMEISGSGAGSDYWFDYTTIDIPVLVRWNFMQSPVAAGILIGPYISFPAGRLNLSTDRGARALDVDGHTLGIAIGFALGYKLGPGNLAADVRYINDFGLLYASEPSRGVYDANICIRRSINITVGYEFAL